MSAVPLQQVAVHLRPEDNIAVAARLISPGQTTWIKGCEVQGVH